MIITFRFISDEEEDFVIDVNINHDQTFEELHIAIQKALNYDANQLASFFKSNDSWEKHDEVTLIDMGGDQDVKTMANTKIEELFSEKNERLLYVFDFFAERLFFGSVSRTIDQESPIKLPSVSKLEGTIPIQINEDNVDDGTLIDDLYSEGLDDPEFKDEGFENLDDILSDADNPY